MNEDNEEEIEDVDGATEDELDKVAKKEEAREKTEIEKQARAKTKKLARKGVRKLKATLFKSIGFSAFTVVSSIIILIFMLIGIVSYIVSMPGFVQNRMSDLVNKITAGISNWWSGDNQFLNDPDSEDFDKAKLGLLQYLDEMGLNPIGMGFVAFASRDTSGKIVNYIDDFMARDTLKKLIGKYSNGDLLYKYIVSAERTYVLNDDGMRGILGLVPENNFHGMLAFYFDAFDKIGTSLSVDRVNKNLKITEIDHNDMYGIGKFYENVFSYDLDSWVGRYGKPIEFLLALHIATMSPDLTEALIDDPNLQTEVHIQVDKSRYDADYVVNYKNAEGEMVESPVTFGKFDDKFYETAMAHSEINPHDDGTVTFDYIDTDEVSASDITISGLHDLISNMKIKKEGNPYTEGLLKTAMERFTGSDWYVTKTTVGSYEVMMEQFSEIPYLCDLKRNEGGYFKIPDETTGILPYIEYSLEWEKIEGIENSQKVEKEGPIGTLYYDGYQAERTLYIDKDSRHAQCFEDSYGKLEINKILGIQAYIDDSEKFFIDDNYDYNCTSIFAMLVAFDQYFYYNNEVFWGNIAFEEYNPSDSNRYEVYDDWFKRAGIITNGNDKIYMNLSKDWLWFVNGKYGEDINRTELENKFRNYKNLINAYLDVIDIDNREKYIQQFIDDILAKEIGEETRGTFKIETINNIYDKLYNVPSKVDFSEPRILYVTKHWFKDIDFRKSYAKADVTKNIKLNKFNETEADLDVTMRLTGQTYEQKSQPYVIKGNTVTLNGEDKKQEYEGIISGNQGIGEIGAGKGYEASKKLFTQGRYYVYDGTEETSRGIYYNKILENTKPLSAEQPNILKVCVIGGRINTISVVSPSGIMLNKDTWIQEGKVIKTGHEEDCNILLYETTGTTGMTRAEDDKSDKEVKLLPKAYWYYVCIKNDISYKLPTQVSYNESVKSAEKINDILDAMGIVNQRQIVSFDTVVTTYKDTADGQDKEVTYSGDVAMLTAFNVLANMHTESAEHIYRDLKEFLIDLGYYTSAEFSYLNTNVLEWFMPDYIPENPSHWKQNTASDSIEYGVVMYPHTENDEGEVTQEGFEPNTDIIAPGNCRVIRHTSDTIVIEFDGTSQPQIGLLNGYSMVISGIKVADVIKTENGDINIKDAEKDKTIINCGSVIATTKDERLVVVLIDNKGAYLSNVEDYMAPKKTMSYSVGELAYYYWIPYESLNPGCVSYRNQNEVAVGISQWTTLDEPGNRFNNISVICSRLYDKDPVLCSSLKTFVGWSIDDIMNDIFYGTKQLEKAFKKIDETNHDAFLALQMQCIVEERSEQMEARGVGWLKEKNEICVGTYFSVINWYPGGDWESVINQSMTPEQIVKALLKQACNYNSTDGNLTSRWESQAKLAVDIITGKFTDLEGWIKNKAAYPEYGEGNNSGYLLK